MKLIECTSCQCTANVEDEDTLHSDWCEVDIPSELPRS